MTAIALPMPMPFRPPMGGGLVGGGVAPPITLEQVLYYLQNNIRPNAGQLFPVPPPLLLPGVGAGLAVALVLEGLFTSPTAREELPEPVAPTVDPGLQPVQEREPGPVTPQPGEWEYRNIDQYVYTQYIQFESLENPPRFSPSLEVRQLSPKSPHFRSYSVDYKFKLRTSEITYGPDQPDALSVIDAYKLEEYQTSTGQQVNDNLQPSREVLTGTTPWYNGQPAEDRFVKREWFEISEVTYKPAELFPRPSETPGPITPQPPVQGESATLPTTKAPIERAEAFPSVVPPVEPIKPLPASAPPGTDVGPSNPDQAPVVPSVPPPVPVIPKTPVPPAAQPTAPDGAIVPKVPDAIPKTPTDTHFPQSGAPGVNTGGVRPSAAAIAAEIGRIEKKLEKTLGSGPIKNWDKLWQILLLLEAFLTAPILGTDYKLTGVCEEADELGNQPEKEFTAATALNLGGVINRIDQIPLMLQQHLEWKTPTCGHEKPLLQGEWVSTRWISDEKMDHSNRRLRKLFRYRTKSTRDLGQLSAYWKDFTWQSGDICVIHKGAWWGTPQVWAASEAEGRRVIRFAATEAGFDPDQVGQWSTSSSRSPRYGMSGTMRIQKFQGFPWVAKRDGSDLPNVLAKASDP